MRAPLMLLCRRSAKLLRLALRRTRARIAAARSPALPPFPRLAHLPDAHPRRCRPWRQGVLRSGWAALGLALLLAACQLQPARPADAHTLAAQEEQQLQQLLLLMEQRLHVALPVAQAKWNSGAPLDDPARERQILQEVAPRAAQAGVEPALAAAFFQSQFDAGKLLQHKLHAQWRAQQRAPFAEAPELGHSVRPLLDRLTPQLLAALGAAQPLLGRPDTAAYLRQAAAMPPSALDDEAWASALQPLLAVPTR